MSSSIWSVYSCVSTFCAGFVSRLSSWLLCWASAGQNLGEEKEKNFSSLFCLPGALHIKIEEGTEGSRDERMGDKLCLRMERWNMDKWING